MDKNVIIPKLKEFFLLKDNIVFAYLFGSYAENKAARGSDIDIGIYLVGVEMDDFFRYKLRYKHELEEILKTSVDLIIMNTAPPLLNHEIFKNGIIIKNNAPSILSQFRMRNFYFYIDQMYIINRYLDATKRRIKEVLSDG
ncbi:type VII toxin-antitoxin system MntA family adenylyltransferase antitoxin [Thermoanaerobacterium sp. DL9XJH110]|jgi:hypothetical protein|uniref:type VII toxin-antitoxin system MntA family adenylyltransferase antitoxin n=1 Tax=Thermoanaerobacterium sp. DL9XJH110 TaxID=3386643 RepID=UPI003BB7893E